VQYKYRLLGLDTTWRYTSSRANFAYYASLLPGTYTFQVAALNDDHFMSDEVRSVSFVIARPFWTTWWFITAFAAAAGAVIYTLYLLRVRRIKAKARQEGEKAQLVSELNKARYKSLQTQMNPHFLFNSMNSIQHLINTGKREEANAYLVEFSKLLRGTLEKADALLIPLSDEISLMQHYLKLESLRLDNGLDFSVTVDERIDMDLFRVPALITHPFVENAILHGIIPLHGKGKITLSFVPHGDAAVLCVVEDNGIGREASQELKKRRMVQHKSMGTQLIYDRIEIINKMYQTNFSAKIIDLYNPDGRPAGTRVELVLMPIGQH
jgi:LytS/YehU family sensor histidine kinase